MKIRNFFLILSSLLLLSCNFFKEDKPPLDKSKLICFLAIDGRDTALLSVDTSNQKMRGLFKMNFGGIRKLDGEVEGVIRGDTLKGHYDFKVNNVEKWYRNPVAFLKTGEKLTMGVGEFVMIWGSPHFNPKIPIDYQKGRFVFEKVNCK